MSRQVITARELSAGAGPARTPGGPEPLASPMGGPMSADASQSLADGYRDRLVKYIPTEIIALYLTLAGVIAIVPEEEKPAGTFWAVFLLLLLLTPLYLSRMEGVKKRQQLVISTACFFVWVFALGGPFTETSWYHSWYGALLLPLFTFSIPLWEAES
jgi:hypothetical protein